ncbi:cytochrome c-type biogenesis protein [Leclercia barmai]|uniref:cytochrome c-type biogenesis protein n=1 Tax=Leclercia barmai TaxID=2785629 RepID=UPI0035CD15E1
MTKGLLALLVLIMSFTVQAVPEVMTFQSEAQEQQYRQLTAELRCPKCQNNSIADSGSLIAADLRQKVYQLTQQGKTRQQIVDFMVARYGTFITYDPPLTPVTLLLWMLPLLAITAGGYAIYACSRARVQVARDIRYTFPPFQRDKFQGTGGSYHHGADGQRCGVLRHQWLPSGARLAAGHKTVTGANKPGDRSPGQAAE